MSNKYWTIVAITLAAGSFAGQLRADDQPSTIKDTTVPATPPAKSTKKAKAAADKTDKKAAADKKGNATAAAQNTAPSVGVGPAVAREKNVNVRGQAAINSEIVTHLKKGDKVTVLEEKTIKPHENEPAKWARIALPAGTPVWVHASFIHAETKTVVPNKLKLRSGPGENYSVLGTLNKGTVVKDIETKGEWMKIEAPVEASAWVAAHLLAPDTAPAIVANDTPKPPPVPVPVAPPPPPPPVAVVEPTPPPPPPVPVAVVPPPVVTPAVDPTPPPPPVNPLPPPISNTPPPPVTNVLPPPIGEAPTPPVEETLVKRVISREGLVRRSVSIQAPTYFVLESLDTHKTINYLFSPTTNIVIQDFENKRILVTGEESLDERWPNTPVITIDSLQPVGP